MKALFRSLIRNLRGRLHGLAGRFWFRIGRVSRARYHFERVLALRGDDFRAYICLGRLAYCSGDYAGWRREYEHARRTCPERYARIWHPFDLIEPRVAGTLVEETGERATWRRTHLAPATMIRTMIRPIAARDDLDTEGERWRFRALGPISPEEIEATDVDDLARRLSEHR